MSLRPVEAQLLSPVRLGDAAAEQMRLAVMTASRRLDDAAERGAITKWLIKALKDGFLTPADVPSQITEAVALRLVDRTVNAAIEQANQRLAALFGPVKQPELVVRFHLDVLAVSVGTDLPLLYDYRHTGSDPDGWRLALQLVALINVLMITPMAPFEDRPKGATPGSA